MTGLITSFFISLAAFLVVLTTIITIHELGHFWMARLFRVKIDRFSVGFGKGLISRVDKRGVEWRVGWIPLGGYVKFAGDLDPTSLPDQAGLDELRGRIIAEQGPGAERAYFHFKPVWQRALIVAAGPAANFVLSLVLLTAFFMAVGEQVVAPRVAQVTPGSPAAEAGFQRGDLITSINGRSIDDGGQVTAIVMLSANDPLRFEVRRGDREVMLVATPRREIVQDEIAGRVRVARIGLGIAPMVRSDVTVRAVNPLEAAAMGAERIGLVLDTTFTYLGRIFTGRESGDLLNGPLGIAKAAGAVAEGSAAVETSLGLRILTVVLNLVQFAALVSIGIGFVNLLPIPVLDGGHLLFYAYEAVAKRPVSARVQDIGYRVGLALLAGLMLFATWNDLQKLSLFKFLGGIAS